MRMLFRLIVALVLLVGLGALVLGYWAGSSRPAAVVDPSGRAGRTTSTAGVDTERAREIGAAAGARVGEAGARASAELGDAALTARIKAKMALDDMVKAREVRVSTEGSTVTLRGTVETSAERDRAERLARETDGITRVVNELTIRK